MKRLRHGVWNRGTFQKLAKRNSHIFPVGFLFVRYRGDGIYFCQQVYYLVIHYSGIVGYHKLSRIYAPEDGKKPVVSRFHCVKHCLVFIQRMLYNGVHVLEYDDRRSGIYGEYRGRIFRSYVDKALFCHNFQRFTAKTGLVARMIYYIGKVVSQQLRNELHKYRLSQIGNGASAGKEDAADDRYGTCRPASYISGDILIPEDGEKVDTVYVVYCGYRYGFSIHAAIAYGDHPDAVPAEILPEDFHVVARAFKLIFHVVKDFRVRGRKTGKLHVAGLEHMFICRLSHIEAVLKDIALCYRIYKVGYVTVRVDIFPYPGRAYILKILVQFEPYHAASYRVWLFAGRRIFPLVGTSSEYNVIHGVYGIFFRRFSVARRVFYYIASGYKV